MAKYIIQGETLKAIADEVRDLTDITDEINPNEMIANMEQVNADVAAQMEIIEQIRTALNGKAGSNAAEIGVLIDQSGVLDSTEGTVEEKVEQLVDKAQWEQVWYEASERIKNAEGLFRGYQGVTIPRTNLILTTTLGNFLSNTSDSDPDSFSKVEYIDYYIDSKNATSAGYAFRFCYNLKWLIGVNTSKMTNISGMFFRCTSLETIQEAFDFSKVTNIANVFNGCGVLKDIRFVPETIKISIAIPSANLTAESIQSIIDGLATLAEGAAAQTLTLSQNLPLTEEQKQAITTAVNNKGWTLAFA